MWMAPLEVMVGSAMSGTPFDRMQLAHWSRSCVGLPFGRVVVDTGVVPLLLPKLATCGELDPPQAAAPIAPNAANTATPPDRRYRLFILRLPLTQSSREVLR